MGCWLGLRTLKTLYFCKVMKNKTNKLKGFLQRILKEIMKKKLFGTSDTGSMRRSSHRSSDPGYYIEDCRISVVFHANLIPFKCGRSNVLIVLIESVDRLLSTHRPTVLYSRLSDFSTDPFNKGGTYVQHL